MAKKASRPKVATFVKRVKRRAPVAAKARGFMGMMTNPSGSVGGFMQGVIPGVGAYTGGYLLSKLPRRLAGSREGRLWDFLRKHGGPLAGLLWLAIVYQGSQRIRQLREHQKSLMIGAGVAAFHVILQSWIPGIYRKLMGIATPQQLEEESERGAGYINPHPSDGFFDAIEREAERTNGVRREQLHIVPGGGRMPVDDVEAAMSAADEDPEMANIDILN